MTGVPFWMGIAVDHLYPDCPSAGRQGVGTVDPLGTDICGRCLRRWKATR